MDAALAAAAKALSAFDPLAALKLVALRDDADALAMRGVAMAQLGDYGKARSLLTRALRKWGRSDPRARARGLAALGEVALARRDLDEAGRVLAEAYRALVSAGDRVNAAFVRLQMIRRLLLIGAVGEAAELHRTIELRAAPPSLRAMTDLVGADLAMRRFEPRVAHESLSRARRAAGIAGIESLADEVARGDNELDSPVARVVESNRERLVRLDELIEILDSDGLLVVDTCRRAVRQGNARVSLFTRPVLLALAATLASAFPGAATRAALVESAFGARRVNESMRARLRVETGRLRRAIADLAEIEPTEDGYVLRPRDAQRVVAIFPPARGEASALLALLRGGESWSTAALANATGTSQRTVQRALTALRDEGRIEAIGRGRSQRWVARPPEGFATTLLLVVRHPAD